MRLRRVTVSGFKTFSRRSEVVLEPGITAVVGPNGSGKSNLVDAIRWALGETNARELRGARMDEVIYSGGQGRAPAGMAQVEIVIDNEEGRLPLDDSEVSITRRVTRGGDSEYRLNGGRVRLRDLERVLGATGLTQAGYSVVAQNDVDAIIEATPAQRRSLVEEAAGVRGLRAAREDALVRTDAVEQRLLRLVDALADAEPRLEELAAQAEVALQHREMAARLAELRGSLAREAWRSARAQLRRARQRLGVALSRAEAAAEAEAGFAARLEQARARLLEAREGQRRAAARLEAARVAEERTAGDLRRFDEHADAGTVQRGAARFEEQAALLEMSEGERQVLELGEQGEATEARLRHLEERLAGLRDAHAAAEEAARVARAAVLGAEERAGRAERTLASATAAARDAAGRVSVLEETSLALVAEAATARDRVAALAADADRAGAEAQAAAGLADAADESLAAARVRRDEARATATAATAEEVAAHTGARELEARAAALRGRVDGVLGAGPLSAAVAAGRLTAVRLVDRIRVRADSDQAAVEAALEEHLGAWVVDDLDGALAVLAGDDGREELLAAHLPEPDRTVVPSGVRPAGEAVDADAPTRGALAHCLDRCWLAPDLAAARVAVATAGGRAVLPDGTVVTAAGVRTGGRPGQTIAVVALEREASAAARRAAEEAEAAAGRAARAAAALAAAESALREAEVAGERARGMAAEASATAAALAASARAEEARAAALGAERQARDAALVTAREEAAARAVDAERAAQELSAAGAALLADREAAVSLADAAEAASVACREHELDVVRAEPEARDVQRRLAAARRLVASAEQRAHVAALRLCAAEEGVIVALARAMAARGRVDGSAGAVSSALAEVEAAAGPLGAAQAAVDALEAERAEVAVAAARAADERDAAQVEVDALEARVAELAEALRDDELDDGPEPDAGAAERAEREITRLERRIAALGPVNGLAPEQHQALATRVGRLRADHDDLAGACTDIRHLAEGLSEEIDRRFDAVFGAVAYHFHLLFEELFPGGRATLRLQAPAAAAEEAEDAAPRRPVPAGVEILAQPAGKRLQSLSLLSGGERALTALAVILALQHVNPSPFYVFDEVDAPLDDANIGRFTRLLQRLARTQQFLVVTHNHATMAAAAALYGVTMEGDGTSRLLSVRLVAGEPVAHAAPERHRTPAVAAL